jgi:hypothetical protein
MTIWIKRFVCFIATLEVAMAFSAPADASAVMQDCCTHQGGSVQCPPGLPPGSGSVQFIAGGTIWRTPDGRTVTVPQATFAACTPASTTPTTPSLPPTTSTPPSTTPGTTTPPLGSTQQPSTTTPPTTTPSGTTPSAPSGPRWPVPPLTEPPPASAPEPVRPLNEPDPSVVPVIPIKPSDDKATEELIQRLGRQRKEQPPTAAERPRAEEPELNISRQDGPCTGKGCNSTLKEDAAMSCYRRTRATAVDAHGVAHKQDLFTQLGLALGIAYADVQPCGPSGICKQPAYDCGGTFFDAAGVPMRVPAPSAATTDEELKHWKASVAKFYLGAYTDSKGQRKLSPGMAELCTNWAAVYFRKDPDPSYLQAFTELQQMGAEQTIGQDGVWLDGIAKAGEANSCPRPPLPPSHDMDVWFVPVAQAETFFAHFRDCTAPDVNGVGGCPHAFDPGNHVKARYLFDAETSQGNLISVFFGDESLAAADGDCMRRANACMRACQDANAALSKQCVDLGGVATPGLCEENVGACSCTQSAPDCKRPSQSKGK